MICYVKVEELSSVCSYSTLELFLANKVLGRWIKGVQIIGGHLIGAEFGGTKNISRPKFIFQ